MADEENTNDAKQNARAGQGENTSAGPPRNSPAKSSQGVENSAHEGNVDSNRAETLEMNESPGSQAESESGADQADAKGSVKDAGKKDSTTEPKPGQPPGIPLPEQAEPAESTTAEQALDETSSSPAKSSNKLAWFACLLAFLGLGASGYLGWLLLQQKDAERELGSVVEEHHTQLQSLQSMIRSNRDDLAGQISQRDRQIARLQQSLVDAGLSIDAHARRLLSLTATTTDDWRLAEVEYLLRLANQRILTSKDASTAISLLKASDEILLELADPRLFKVRKTIAGDIAALASVGEYDVDGVFLELAALAQQVKGLQSLLLPEFRPGNNENAELTQEDPGTGQPGWIKNISRIAATTWEELKSLIVIQQVDTPVKPLLPPDQQFYLKNNLRLLINQAQLALLDGRQQVYSQSLASAADWVEEFFPQSNAANAAMFESLQRLGGLQISSEYPDVSDSLLSITAFIREQHRMAAGESGQAAPETGESPR